MSSNQQLAELLGLGPAWRTAMEEVPREAFVPTVGLANPEDGDPYPIDRDARPAEARDDDSFSLLLFEVGAPERSWAACDYQPGESTFEVTQFGDRRLWNEVEDAFAWWVGQDSPGVDRFGLVVSPEGERVWLDHPSHLV